MTLIVSYLNKYGVVLASDSNLSNKKGNAGFGQKVFPISFLKAGVTYSGLYEIGGQDIDDWLNQFIRNESFITNSIELFVENLCNQLNLEFNGSTGEGAILHICGYSQIDYASHLEHWHISNYSLQDDGNYKSRDRFSFQNDFNSRTRKKDLEILQRFDVHPENHQFFINGFPPARISLMLIKSNLESQLNKISSNHSWSFRSPKNLFESANKLKMYFHLIGELFKMSDYPALFVGGETQTFLIPAPDDLKKN